MADATIAESLHEATFVDFVDVEVLPPPPPPPPAAEGVEADSTITETFDYTFGTAAASGGAAGLVPFPWPVSVDGRAFAIDLARYGWEIPDMVRQAIDFSARPGEQSFDTAGVWLRTSGDWSLGAGQKYLDADQASPRRFDRSLGIDCWTRRQLSLLPDTELLSASADSFLRMLAHGPYLYLMETSTRTLTRTTNPQDVAPTLTPITGGPAANFVDMTSDGDQIYVATASGIYIHDVNSATTMTAFPGAAGSEVVEKIVYANGWLLASATNVLKFIVADGTVTDHFTHNVAGFRWNAIVGTPSFIYAGGQATDVAEIFRIGLDEETGNLGVPIHAGELPRGEMLRSLSYYGSALLIGTSRGLRLGLIGSNGSLEVGELIETGTDAWAAFGEGKYIWFSWSNYDSTHTGVGRANLAAFASDNVPAHASDVMAARTGAVVDVVRFANRTYFAVATSGFWREEYRGKRVAEGTIDLGKLEWGTFEPKTFLGVEIITEPLEGIVDVDLVNDVGVAVRVGRADNQGSTGLGRTMGAGLAELSTFFGLTLTLTRSLDPTQDFGTTPIVRLLTARALPIPRQVQRWSLPIICKEHVRIGPNSDVEVSQDVAEIRGWFLALRRAARPVVYQEGQTQYLVIVRGVAFDPPLVEQWAHNRNGLQGTLMVTLDSAEP